MNIFMLDDDPILCARYHCDEHISRSIMEYGQMLCTAHILRGGGNRVIKHDNQPVFIMDETFTHPCSQWTRSNGENYGWLRTVLKELHIQNKKRFGRESPYIDMLPQLDVTPRFIRQFQVRTPVPQILPTEFHRRDPVDAYRGYYVARKGKLAKWTLVGEPPWWAQLKAARVSAGGAMI